MKRIQLRLQTALLFMALIALAVAWWSDHRVLTKQLRDAKARIQFLETSNIFDGSPLGSRR